MLILSPWNYPLNLSLGPLVGALAAGERDPLPFCPLPIPSQPHGFTAIPRAREELGGPGTRWLRQPGFHVCGLGAGTAPLLAQLYSSPGGGVRWAPALQVCEDQMEMGRGYTGPALSPPHPTPPRPTGNCVVLKPSEISKNTEKVLAEVLPRYLDQVSQARCRPGSHNGAERGQASPLGPGQDLSSDLLWVVWPWPSHQLLCSPLRETEGWGLSPGAPCLSLVILTSVPIPTLPDPNLTRAGLVLPLPSAPGGLPAPHPAQLEPWHRWVRPGKGGAAPGRQAAPWALRLGPQREPPFVRPTSQSCFAVVLGGPQETGRLLEHKFDYIFFTGEGPAARGRSGGARGMGGARGLRPARGLVPSCWREAQRTEVDSQPGRTRG